jgi:hypothetical protein
MILRPSALATARLSISWKAHGRFLGRALALLFLAVALCSAEPSSFDHGTPIAHYSTTISSPWQRTPAPTIFAYNSYQRPPAWKAPLRMTLGLLALASFGTAVYFDIDADKRAQEQRDITAAYMAAPEGSDFEAFKTQWRSKNDGIDQSSTTANICWAAGGALTLGWVWLYAF